jgi:hypothetical protein
MTEGALRNSPEARAKMSAAARHRNPDGEARRVAALRTPEHRARLRAVQWRLNTPQAIAKRVATRRLKMAAIAAKISAALRGRTMPPETRAKLSAALKGRAPVRYPDTGAKISASKKAAFARQPQRPRRVIGICTYCGRPANTRDHIIPRCRGGSDDPSNLTPACLECNASKRELTPDEWLVGVRHVSQNPSGRSHN